MKENLPNLSGQELEVAERMRSLKYLRESAQALILGIAVSISSSPASAQNPKFEKRAASVAKKEDGPTRKSEQYRIRLEQLKKQETEICNIFGLYSYHMVKSHRIEDKLRQQEELTLQGVTASEEFTADPFDQIHGPIETNKTSKTVTEYIPARPEEGGVIGLDKKKLKEILQTTFPKGWVNNEVASVEYIDEVNLTDLGAEVRTVIAELQYHSPKDRVVFYKSIREEKLESVVRTLAHEFGHANDWTADNEMTLEERNQLLLDIHDRILSKDRFVTSYIEVINYTDNPERTAWRKAVEYWAVICEQYFTDHTKLHVKDFYLVNRVVRKSDPSFDVDKAQKKREKIIAKILSNAAPVVDMERPRVVIKDDLRNPN